MSEQLNQVTQSALTSQELRQRMLEELEASKQAIEELSDEELEEVAGGGISTIISRSYAVTVHNYKEFKPLYQKTAATTVVTAIGGGATAAGVHK